jgi:ubiquinone/menaquinone biosynthesis C-methylase UbiE
MNLLKIKLLRNRIFRYLMQISPSSYLWKLFWQYRHLYDKDWTKVYMCDTAHPHRKLLIETISKYITPESKVLEIGCCTGVDLYLLNQKCQANYYGIDISKKAINTGIQWLNNYSNIRLHQSNASRLMFPDKSIDVIFTDACLVTMDFRTVNNVISEMKRVTKSAIILLEFHSKWQRREGIYWIHDFTQYFKYMQITKITKDNWDNPKWIKYGCLIEVKL